MKLKKGDNAPNFSGYTTKEEAVSLEGFRGKKILLSFYRYASCPLCNLRIQELISYQAQLESGGFEIIAVFQSSSERIKSYVEKDPVPFKILPDPDLVLYKKYGLEGSWLGLFKAVLKPSKFIKARALGFSPGPVDGPVNRLPGDFIIDEKGRLLECHYGKDIGDHLSIEKIMTYL